MSTRAPIADAIEELIRVYQVSLLLPTPSGIDYGKDSISHGEGGHGSHKPRSTPSFGQDVPMPVWLEGQLQRLAVVARRRLEVETGGAAAVPNGDTKSKARKAETAAILAEVGRPTIEVAYLYGRTERGIQELRKRHGKDDEGYPLPREARPLTAPVRDQLSAHLSATNTTTEDQ